MPRLVQAIPKYRRHRASGQAVVTIFGKDHYLGPHGTKPSKREYDRLVTEWLAAGRPLAKSRSVAGTTITKLVASYWQFAQQYYRKDGQSTGTADTLKPSLRLLRSRYGDTLAVEFTPKDLKAFREEMISRGNTRRYINDCIDRVRGMFRWAVEEEIIPESVYAALRAVKRLCKGRTTAREAEPILPVDDAVVDATLPHLPPIVAAMVTFQRLTGARPAEVCLLRPSDIDRSGEIWVYTPERHKTEHHGRGRSICIGPRAQEVLAPFLDRAPAAYCFSPAEGEAARNADRRKNRRSPMTPSQAKRCPKTKRARAPRERYTTDTYRRAIHRACDIAFPPPAPLALRAGETQNTRAARLTAQQQAELAKWLSHHRWAPNQLRHAAATEIRRKFGLEAAQVTLGHAKADVTQVYAERDLAKAAEVARAIG
jgi:integrase